ncbi:hypothetical protein CERSUDRAFT_101702 [Gelatoporia subvermispora B]|uniref:Uncharacterized protein n=1 Tax=Ceriporiopsis subvermispora (strain B) TaxID=914234 RepID=M2Q064_CERS8|nr:hypothetical protein CERSUDRAFT_101702 [Gelatoporia subvermispora B]
MSYGKIAIMLRQFQFVQLQRKSPCGITSEFGWSVVIADRLRGLQLDFELGRGVPPPC